MSICTTNLTNLNPQYNFTIAHKGYKSLGKYLSTRSRGNQFRFISNFKSKNQLNQTQDKETSPEKIKAQEALNKAKAWFNASKSE